MGEKYGIFGVDLICGMGDELRKQMEAREADNIEEQIRELERSDYVRTARAYAEYREKRLAYLQELKELERKGRRLKDRGWEAPGDAEE